MHKSLTVILSLITAVTMSTLTSTMPTVNAGAGLDMVVFGESWESTDSVPEQFQFNVERLDNGRVVVSIIPKETLDCYKEYTIGIVKFDSNYYTIYYDERIEKQSGLAAVRSWANDGNVQFEFVRLNSSWTIPTGTTFDICFTKCENATGSPAIIAFGHDLAVNTSDISDEGNQILKLQNQIADLQTDLNKKSQTISKLQDTITQLQQELTIKEQLLQDQTTLKNLRAADINGDGVVNVRDLLTLKKLLMSNTVIEPYTDDPFQPGDYIKELTVY